MSETAVMVMQRYDETAFVRFEAMRVADEQGITDVDGLQAIEGSLRHRYFLRAVEPWVQEKVRLHSVMLPKIVFYPTENRVETTYGYTDEQRKWLDEIDRHIAREAEKWQQIPLLTG
jgi:hypothetical protein